LDDALAHLREAGLRLALRRRYRWIDAKDAARLARESASLAEAANVYRHNHWGLPPVLERSIRRGLASAPIGSLTDRGTRLGRALCAHGVSWRWLLLDLLVAACLVLAAVQYAQHRQVEWERRLEQIIQEIGPDGIGT
jgi:hypothetical protein